jgi:hypothetical protein
MFGHFCYTPVMGEGGAGTAVEVQGLEQVEDNTWLRVEENNAYYSLLAQARDSDPLELQAAATEFLARRKQQLSRPVPIFKELLDHPAEFRGQPITLRGHVQQITTYPAAPNDWGIEQLYEASFFEEDSQGNLTTVIFLELPPGVAVSDQLVDRVTVTGYFLKIYYYDAQDRHTRKAPLILARTLAVAQTTNPPPLIPFWLTVTLALTIAAGLLGLIVRVQWLDRQAQLARQRQLAGQMAHTPTPPAGPAELPQPVPQHERTPGSDRASDER